MLQQRLQEVIHPFSTPLVGWSPASLAAVCTYPACAAMPVNAQVAYGRRAWPPLSLLQTFVMLTSHPMCTRLERPSTFITNHARMVTITQSTQRIYTYIRIYMSSLPYVIRHVHHANNRSNTTNDWKETSERLADVERVAVGSINSEKLYNFCRQMA